MKTVIKSAALGLALSMSFGAAWAEYPDAPVSFVNPFPPGDLEDIIGRFFAEDFQEEYDVPTALVNKPGGGAGPFPGAIEVSMAPADGSMIGIFVMDVPLVGPQLGIPELAPNPFEPVGIFGTYPFVVATHKDAPFNSVEELAAYSKDNRVVVGHFGPELTPTQLTFAMAKENGIEIAADSAYDGIDCGVFAARDANVFNTTLPLVLPCLDDIKVLVSFTEKRIPLVDYAPAIGELSPNLAMGLWAGLFVHKDTPEDVRAAIEAVAQKTAASERAQNVANETGAFVYWKGAKEAQEQIDQDLKVMGYMADLLQ